MNIGSISSNPLLYTAISKNKPSGQNDNSNYPKIINSSFELLLEQALLQAKLTNISTGKNDSTSLFNVMNPVNFTSLGLSTVPPETSSAYLEMLSAILGQGNTDLGRRASIGADHSYIEKAATSFGIGNLSVVGNTLQYQDISVASLDSFLKGKLQNTGELFVEAGKKHGINPAFLAAISMHETGNGTSNAARFKNNVAGMMGKNGLKSYESVQDSIFDMARNLRNNYLNQGKTTVSAIGAKYAPIGASNDPTNLNNHWVTGVETYFDKITKKTDF